MRGEQHGVVSIHIDPTNNPRIFAAGIRCKVDLSLHAAIQSAEGTVTALKHRANIISNIPSNTPMLATEVQCQANAPHPHPILTRLFRGW